MKISELMTTLERAQAEHGDLDVLVRDEELGEYRDTRCASVEKVTVWRDRVPMIKAVTIDADYDG